MHDSVPSQRYLPVCNVLCQWKTSLIPSYRVYRLYDYCIIMVIIVYIYIKGKICFISYTSQSTYSYIVSFFILRKFVLSATLHKVRIAI